jgi:hypothetical protein
VLLAGVATTCDDTASGGRAGRGACASRSTTASRGARAGCAQYVPACGPRGSTRFPSSASGPAGRSSSSGSGRTAPAASAAQAKGRALECR